MAAKNTAGLLQLANTLASTKAGLVLHLMPSQFGNVLEDAGQQCAALCIGCACHQVQVLNLRLATSDLFDVPAASISGTPLARMPWLTCIAKHLDSPTLNFLAVFKSDDVHLSSHLLWCC